ncbi:MAG TPA: thioredoxin domain-containing protein [Nitriliruptoraceae bacterium]|nr:thioredoxin domain-containing protein [Nitriliruptoraceae bacterium]
MPNRLASSNSPYLLQHADNPVDWWEWGDEAFAEAVRRDVPVFLSVGYSSCHWCHVMAHESFEDATTAALLNDNFVSVKVDREVRPDVDAIYMTATQALTGQGGWPMSVWLDHERRPFYAGTYFPPQPSHGHPSFRQLLTSLAEAWQTRRDEVEASAADITAALQAHNDPDAASSGPPPTGVAAGSAATLTPSDDESSGAFMQPLGSEALGSAVELVVTRAWDRDLGGFGRAPKFPQAMTIQWLLDHHAVTGDALALEAAVSSLQAMARGGIHDHVVGGFARYSTDARWLLPHFEKMLYDNGLLLECFATAAVLTGSRELRAAAEGIAGWLVDDMQADEGGFFAALDADTEGHEGATTVWTDAEFREVVGAAGVDEDLAAAWFGVLPEGNFRPERGVPQGENILHTPVSLEDFAATNDLQVDAWQVQVATMVTALARRRADRAQPGLDDKVIVSWNALAIRGLARAAALLGRDDWAGAALRAVEFIRAHMRDEHGDLLHVHRGGTSWVPAFLDDEAGLAVALMELAPVIGRDDLVVWAIDLVDHAAATFDDGAGGFVTTRSDATGLLLRPRDQFDNAQPAGTSLLAAAAVRVARVTGDSHHADLARRILAAGEQAAATNPTGFGELLRAAQFLAADQREVAIVGPPGPARDALAAATLGASRPGTVTVVADGAAAPTLPLLVGREARDGQPRAWVCRDFACQLPVTTPAALLAHLDGAGGGQ